jgi:glutaredoxin
MTIRLILYSKPGCHLCEGLQEKLAQIRSFPFDLEVRDITSREDWLQAYQYEVPVLFFVQADGLNGGRSGYSDDSLQAESASLQPIPRLSPRATVRQLEQMLQKYIGANPSE